MAAADDLDLGDLDDTGGGGSPLDSQDDSDAWDDVETSFTGDTVDLGLKLNRFKHGLIKLMKEFLKKCEKSGKKPEAFRYRIPFKEIKSILSKEKGFPAFDMFGYHGRLKNGKIHPKILKIYKKYMKERAKYLDFVKNNNREDPILLQPMKEILAVETLVVSLFDRAFERIGKGDGFRDPVNIDNEKVRFFKPHEYAVPDKIKPEPVALPDPKPDPKLVAILNEVITKYQGAEEQYKEYKRRAENYILDTFQTFGFPSENYNPRWLEGVKLHPSERVAIDQLAEPGSGADWGGFGDWEVSQIFLVIKTCQDLKEGIYGAQGELNSIRLKIGQDLDDKRKADAVLQEKIRLIIEAHEAEEKKPKPVVPLPLPPAPPPAPVPGGPGSSLSSIDSSDDDDSQTPCQVMAAWLIDKMKDIKKEETPTRLSKEKFVSDTLQQLVGMEKEADSLINNAWKRGSDKYLGALKKIKARVLKEKYRYIDLTDELREVEAGKKVLPRGNLPELTYSDDGYIQYLNWSKKIMAHINLFPEHLKVATLKGTIKFPSKEQQRLFEDCVSSLDTPAEILEVLKQQFGSITVIQPRLERKVTELADFPARDTVLKTHLQIISNYVRVMVQHGVHDIYINQSFVNMSRNKLSRPLLAKLQEVSEGWTSNIATKYQDFITKQIQFVANRILTAPVKDIPGKVIRNTRENEAVDQQNVPKKRKCMICEKENHYTVHCFSLMDEEMEKKVQAAKSCNVCLQCGFAKFDSDHAKICKGKDNKFYCKECKMNNAFCKHTPVRAVERNLRGSGDQAIFEEEEVMIVNPLTGQKVKVHAVYDSCDSNIECSLATAQKLGLKLQPRYININNFGHTRQEKGFTSEVQMIDSQGNKHQSEVLITDSLQYTTPAVKFEHLPEEVAEKFGVSKSKKTTKSEMIIGMKWRFLHPTILWTGKTEDGSLAVSKSKLTGQNILSGNATSDGWQSGVQRNFRQVWRSHRNAVQPGLCSFKPSVVSVKVHSVVTGIKQAIKTTQTFQLSDKIKKKRSKVISNKDKTKTSSVKLGDYPGGGGGGGAGHPGPVAACCLPQQQVQGGEVKGGLEGYK